MHFILSIQQRFINYEASNQSDNYYIPFTNFNSILKNNTTWKNNNDPHYVKINNYSYYNYSFDENINLHKNGKAELNFKMLKYILLESNFVTNPFINKIKIGSIISYQDFSFFDNEDDEEDKNGKTRLFLVTGINYTFNKMNIEYSYSCQDYFSYINTRKNSGYNIQDNKKGIIITKTVNDWATKIQTDCSMEYIYQNLEDNSLNQTIMFSISNSNAYNALVSLVEKVGLIIEIDDINKTFWFKLAKNPNYKGLLYSPHTDIKDFSLSQSGQTLTSVINVNNVTRGNQNIGLLSDIPEKLIQYFNTPEWETTKFSSGFYKQKAYDLNLWYKEQNSAGIWEEKIDPKLNNFLTILDNIPWLEPKIINLDYMLKNHLLTKKEYINLWDKLSNDLRIVNGKMLYYQTNYYNFLKASTKWIADINTKLISYGGAFQKDIIDIIEPHDTQTIVNKPISYPGDESDFKKEYDNLYKKLPIKSILINYTTLIEEYGNKLIKANQEFLKNIYLFDEKFKEINAAEKILSNNTTTENAITINEDYDLTMYWNAAYDVSYVSDYFLPKDWKTALYQYNDTSKTIKFIGVKNYNKFIPSINQTFVENSYTRYILAKNSTETNLAINTLNQINSNWKWKGQPGTETKEYYYNITNLENNYMWNSVLKDLPDREWKPFNGTNRIFLVLLAQNAESDKDNLGSSLQNTLDNSIANHNAVWTEIYQKFGHILLEQVYEDTISINSTELYNNAVRYFEDLSNPENQFNLSIIGVNNLKGYKGRRLEISDQIRLAADDFYEDLDNLKEIIKQPLFITDISYNLRSSESIKLTVNVIKYEDKIIQRLVSLIK